MRRLARDERRDHALGHPLPLSNFSDVRKRGVSHAVHTSTPGSLSSFSGLDHGGSVPAGVWVRVTARLGDASVVGAAARCGACLTQHFKLLGR